MATKKYSEEEARQRKNERQREYLKRTGNASTKKYQKENTKQIGLVLNLNTDADILQRLAEVPNKQGYIKELIRTDIAKQNLKK